MVQETLKRDPMCGHLFVFRGRGGGLIKVIWHDGQGACLFTNDRRSYYTSFLAS
ncbi:IS66 family insertion sequence element accessory protein TnpB [Rhizobium leguminosarum]|uniref:IS66 family insertion sequence element accessory protein TnpB n=2 Tax=Rhizobium TaxID=379 RepID=UPI0003FE2DA5|nr:IS66 family insertion sequence element accessory protein TnpB [Rhizobium leguminosarum]